MRFVKDIEGCEESLDVTGLFGKWILVVGGKIVGNSDKAGEVLRLAKKYPVEDAYVTMVLYPGESYYQNLPCAF